MEYPEVDFHFETQHFAIFYRLTGAVFRFDGYPDPTVRIEARVSFPRDVDDNELAAMYSAAGSHLKARIDRTRS